MKRTNTLRHAIQIITSLFLLFNAWQFYRFVSHVQSMGAAPYTPKPSVIEAFLPISALLGLKQWLFTGLYDPIHPAGLSIFLIILITALIFKKAFCSWVCPIGALSELLALLGEKFWGRNFIPFRPVDLLLMLPKYLFLAFFIKVIFIDMTLANVQAFLYSPYNMLSDIKMLYFFLDMSKTTFIILLILAVLSLFIKLFWCRYLCPYGALQGILSIFSFFKVKRNKNSCTSCKKCDQSCPAMITVSEKEQIFSPECSSCLNCITSCPVKNCLNVQAGNSNLILKPKMYPILFIATFLLLILVAKITGHWESSLSIETFYMLAPRLEMFSHP